MDKFIFEEEYLSSCVEVYNNLQDEESRNIYEKRIMYSLTNDKKYIREMLDDLSLKLNVAKYKGKKCFIWGAGFYGRKIKLVYDEVDFCGFIDNNTNIQGSIIDGLAVYSPDILLNSDAFVFIANKYHSNEILQQMLDMGVKKNRIYDTSKNIYRLSDRQYFDLSVLPRKDEEIFVDVGSLNGDTAKQFIKWSHQKFKSIYCFEPDFNNIEKIRKNMKHDIESKCLYIVDKGAWCTRGGHKFKINSDGTSAIDDDGEITIETTTLDYELQNVKVTFIKMDIEGAELEALRGAENIIKQNKPKLAISIYHKDTDIFTIPELILSYNQEYKFYIRHYSPFDNETILYAFCE